MLQCSFVALYPFLAPKSDILDDFDSKFTHLETSLLNRHVYFLKYLHVYLGLSSVAKFYRQDVALPRDSKNIDTGNHKTYAT